MNSIEIAFWIRDWQEISKITDLKIPDTDFRIWDLMDEWVDYSYCYYPNIKDILNNVNLNKKPSWRLWFMNMFYKKRTIIRKQYSRLLNKPIPEGKRILYFSRYFWSGQRDIHNMPIIKQFKDHVNILIDTPSEHAKDFHIKRIMFKSKTTDNIIDRCLEEFYGGDGKISSDYKKIKEGYAHWKKNSDKGDKWPQMQPLFDFFINKRLKAYLRNFYMIKNALESLKPNAVVYYSEGGTFGKILFFHCKKMNIPCIALQHGWLRQDTKLIHKTLDYPTPAKLCVWGEAQKDFMVKYGKYKEEDVIITGNQRYDSIKTKYNKEHICKKLGLDPNKKIIFFPDQGETTDMNKDFQIIKKYCPQLISKYHPSTKKKYDIRIFPQDYDIFKLIAISDVVITTCSGVGMEAMLLDKPIIVWNVFEESNYFVDIDYVKEKAAIGVYKEKDISSALKRSYKDELKETRRQYIKKRVMFDQKASEHIKNVVEVFL